MPKLGLPGRGAAGAGGAADAAAASAAGAWESWSAGYRLVDLIEPEWPPDHDRVWGGWSRLRGLLTPGTAIYVADLDPRTG